MHGAAALRRTLRVVLGAPRVQVVDALGHALAVGAEQGLDALVHLDARDDALGLHQLHQRRAVVRVLVQRLLEQDDTRDVLLQACTAKNST
jgi:hypothetical protein